VDVLIGLPKLSAFYTAFRAEENLMLGTHFEVFRVEMGPRFDCYAG